MATFNRNIPFYWAELSDNEDGMVCVSLVDDPAVDRNFMAFSAEKKIPVCAISNEEKRLVRGVLMRADFPIYRVAPTGEEFYIIFSAPTIRRMTERFLEQGNQGNVNTMHIPGSDVDGVNLVQLFIKDKSAGIDPAGFEDVEDGSLFGEYHVANDDVWEDIKAGKFKGFSIEGIFSVSKDSHQFNKQQINEMAKLEKLKTRLAKLLAEFGVVSTDKGTLYWDGDEDLKAGDMVHKESESGERSAAPDGQYTTEDGKPSPSWMARSPRSSTRRQRLTARAKRLPQAGPTRWARKATRRPVTPKCRRSARRSPTSATWSKSSWARLNPPNPT